MTRPLELTGFCRDTWPRLVGGLSLYTGDRFLAEELAQEALVRLCEQWEEVRLMESPLGWVHRVGFNLANSHFRRRRAESRAKARLRARVDVAPAEVDSADALALRAAVASLPDTQRRTILLRYYADLSVAEVAAVMQCPENTVKTHSRRAIGRLRDRGLFDDPPMGEALDA